MRRLASLAALTLAWAGPLLAQVGETPVAPVPSQEAAAARAPAAAELPQDRIMAVVGESVLLLSEWRDQTLVLSQQLGIAPGSPGFRQLAIESFQQMVDDLVVVAAAERDTAVHLTEDEVLEAVDREIAQVRSRFPSEDAFQRQLAASPWGSLAAYRADLQDRKRRELLGQMYIEAHRLEIRPQPVTDAEVREVWEQNQDQVGATPTLVRFEEVPVPVTPSEAARDSARAKAQRIKDDLLAGDIDFATAAQRYSSDEANRDEGGDLGWFGHGRMVAPFEEAAFAAVLGDIVGPVESAFGMHLIQVIDRREDEVRARHVLIPYDLTEDDKARARAEAEGIRDLVLAGADVDSLQEAAMPGDSAAAGVLEIEPDRLPQVYADALAGLAEGQAAVLETPTGYSVVVARGEAGGEPLTYEAVAPRIRQQLGQQKAEEAFVQRLRDQIYVDVRVHPEDVLGPSG